MRVCLFVLVHMYMCRYTSEYRYHISAASSSSGVQQPFLCRPRSMIAVVHQVLVGIGFYVFSVSNPILPET